MFKNLPFWSLTPEGYQLTLFIFFSFISYSWFFIYVQRFRNGTTRIGHFIKIIIIIIIIFDRPAQESVLDLPLSWQEQLCHLNRVISV